ncbi:hypothetical protein Hanom_Chr04g00300971 [Helianthus anomalus]
MQGDDVSNDPSACREILGGLGTPFEVDRARGLPLKNRINQLSSMLVGSSIIANAFMEDYNVLGRREEETIRLRAEDEAMVKGAREGAEQLKKDKAAFEKLKQTETWPASADLKQELTNLKAANAALIKEKAATEAAAKEAETRGATALKEVEARAFKALEEADADCTKLNKAVEELKIVETIHDAPENAYAANEVKECARQAGFKAGYTECLTHVNPFFKSRFTDERSGFHGVDTEAVYAAVVDAYNNLSNSSLDDIEKFLEAEDYVDRLRLLFDRPEDEDEAAGGAKNDAGTSGTKAV